MPSTLIYSPDGPVLTTTKLRVQATSADATRLLADTLDVTAYPAAAAAVPLVVGGKLAPGVSGRILWLSPGDSGYLEAMVEVDIASATYLAPAERLTDGDMEAAGVGDWTAGFPAISKESDGAGGQCLRVAYNGTGGPQQVTQAGLASIQYETYRMTGRVRGSANGVTYGTPRIYPAAYGYTLPYIDLPKSTDWTAFDETFEVNSTELTAFGAFLSGAYADFWYEFDDLSFTKVGEHSVLAVNQGSLLDYNGRRIELVASVYTRGDMS